MRDPEEVVETLIDICPGYRDLSDEDVLAWEFMDDQSDGDIQRYLYLGGFEIYRAQIVCSRIESADFNLWSSMVRCGEALIHNEPSPTAEKAADKVRIITEPLNAVDDGLQEAQKRTAEMSVPFVERLKKVMGDAADEG